MTTKEPLAFEPTQQKTVHDCAVACLKMLLGVSYEDAVAAFPRRAKVHKHGASDRQVLNAAKRLGRVLTFEVDVDLSDDVGILQVRDPEGDIHVAMLVRGSVYDPGPDLLWADVGSWLWAGSYKVCGVFTEEDE